MVELPGRPVSTRIFKGCGQPRILPAKRNKRETAQGGEATSYEDYAYGRNFNLKEGRRTSGERPETAAGTNLDRLVRDIKEKVQDARDFWVQLPYSICNGELAAQPGEDTDCWNGQDRARYVPPVQQDGRMYQVNNPEVTVDVQKDNGIVSVQIYNLKLITGKLHNAYNGVEVEWTSEVYIDGSDDVTGSGDDLEGSGDDLETGSGSGSGVPPDDEDMGPATRRPPSRPGFRPVRPVRPHKSTDDIDFDEPTYDVKNKPKTVNTTPSRGAMVTPSLLLATLCVCLRFVGTWL